MCIRDSLCTDLGPSGGTLASLHRPPGVPHRGTPVTSAQTWVRLGGTLHRPPGAGGYIWLGPHHLRTDPGPPHASTLASLHRPRGPNKRKPQAGVGPAVCTPQRSRQNPHRQPKLFSGYLRNKPMVPSYRPRLGSPYVVPGDGPRLRIIKPW